MTSSTTNIDYSAPYAQTASRGNVFQRSEAWLDARGKPAWIAVTVLAFIFAWPIGLALVAYMIWSKRMFNASCASKRTAYSSMRTTMRPSGNSAFDAYKADTLRRLEDEQHSFEEFLKRLRDAKDKAEFDQFMEDRAKRAETDAADTAA